MVIKVQHDEEKIQMNCIDCQKKNTFSQIQQLKTLKHKMFQFKKLSSERNLFLTRLRKQQQMDYLKKKRPPVPKFQQFKPEEPSMSFQAPIFVENQEESSEGLARKIEELITTINVVLIKLRQIDDKLFQKCLSIITYIMNSKKNYFSDKNILYMAATIIIASCYSYKIPLSIQKISDFLGIDKRSVLIYLRDFNNVCQYDQMCQQIQEKQKQEDNLKKVAYQLNFPVIVQQAGQKIFEQIKQKGLDSGFEENVVIGCSLKMASLLNYFNFSGVNECCGVSNDEISRFYKSIFHYRFHLIDDCTFFQQSGLILQENSLE